MFMTFLTGNDLRNKLLNLQFKCIAITNSMIIMIKLCTLNSEFYLTVGHQAVPGGSNCHTSWQNI